MHCILPFNLVTREATHLPSLERRSRSKKELLQRRCLGLHGPRIVGEVRWRAEGTGQRKPVVFGAGLCDTCVACCAAPARLSFRPASCPDALDRLLEHPQKPAAHADQTNQPWETRPRSQPFAHPWAQGAAMAAPQGEGTPAAGAGATARALASAAANRGKSIVRGGCHGTCRLLERRSSPPACCKRPACCRRRSPAATCRRRSRPTLPSPCLSNAGQHLGAQRSADQQPAGGSGHHCCQLRAAPAAAPPGRRWRACHARHRAGASHSAVAWVDRWHREQLRGHIVRGCHPAGALCSAG